MSAKRGTVPRKREAFLYRGCFGGIGFGKRAGSGIFGGILCREAKKSFRSSLFQKADGWRAEPFSRSTESETPIPLRLGRNPKRRKGGPQAARGCPRGYALRVGLWLPRDRLRGDGFECPVGFAGLYPAGKPLDRVPLGPTAHRAVGPSFLIFLGIIRGISLSAESDQRLCLWNPPAFWETQSRFSVLGRAAFLLSKGHGKYFSTFFEKHPQKSLPYSE